MIDSGLSATDGDQLKAQLVRVKRPINTASTLPPACYSDAAILHRKLATVFQRSWIGKMFLSQRRKGAKKQYQYAFNNNRL